MSGEQDQQRGGGLSDGSGGLADGVGLAGKLRVDDHDGWASAGFIIDDEGVSMSEPGGKSAPRPKADNDEDAARKDVNPDLHGQAKDVEEKRANDDPETTGA